MFATEPPAAIDLCRRLGVTDQLLTPDTRRAGAQILFRGRFVPIPEGFVLMRATSLWSMLRTPLLSWRGKLRFLMEPFRGPVHADQLDPSGDISVGQFVRHRMGEEVLERLVEPLVAGIYTGDIERLSLRGTMRQFAEMVDQHGSLAAATLRRRRASADRVERQSAGARYEKFRGFPLGMQQLIDLLADAIGRDRIFTQRKVTALAFAEDGWTISMLHGSETKRLSFDRLVLATPPRVASKLLGDVGRDGEQNADALREHAVDASSLLSQISAASAAIVVLCVRKDSVARLPEQFGCVIPPKERRRILAISFASHKFPVRCPEDHTIIRVFLGGVLQQHLLDQSDEELIGIAKEELAELIGLDGVPTIEKVVRWDNAMPQYEVGHPALSDSIVQSIEAIPNLELVTNSIGGVGIGAVVASGKETADRIAAEIEA